MFTPVFCISLSRYVKSSPILEIGTGEHHVRGMQTRATNFTCIIVLSNCIISEFVLKNCCMLS